MHTVPHYAWSSEGWGHHSETETKDSFVLFFALLSVLQFGCLVFSTLHNANQIAQLQRQLQEISDECHNDHGSNMQTSQQEIPTN